MHREWLLGGTTAVPVNNPIEIFCQACQKEASIPHGQPLVCPHCQGDATADAEAEPTIETPPPPPPPPPSLPKAPLTKAPLTEAQMTVQLLTKIHDKLSVMQVMMIIWFVMSVFGWLVQIVGATNGRRW